jgi:phage terminase Nu1 subunit (DNA packaging protein)
MGQAARRQEIAELVGGDDAPIPATATTIELADLLGITERHVNQLAGRDVLAKIGRGTFDTRASLRGFLDYAKRRGNVDLDAAKLRLVSEQAEKVELQNATVRGELVPAAEVEREWAGILRDVRAAMLALPPRLSSLLPHLSASDIAMIDREIRDVLTETANA